MSQSLIESSDHHLAPTTCTDTANLSKNHLWWQRAQQVTPGGVNSPVRAFGAVGGEPVFVVKGQGPYIFDVQGRCYIDYVCSYGPLILGHAAAPVITAIQEAAEEGTTFGMPTPREVKLAEKIVAAVKNIEQIRFVSSGTEATMSALRLARGVTKRDKLLKFTGCYHGHADAFLSEAGSGIATFGIPGSPGVPEAVARDVVSIPFNDAQAAEKVMQQEGTHIAAIIVEPIACNYGMIKALPGFLATLRQLCDHYGALLIMDEVITGFRLRFGAIQDELDVLADLTTFGKIIGGGLPAAAYGGPRRYMQQVAPTGKVYQAGTLSGNPLAMAAGLAVIENLNSEVYVVLQQRCEMFAHHANALFLKYGAPVQMLHWGSIFYLWCCPQGEKPPTHVKDIQRADKKFFRQWFQKLLYLGVHLAPSNYEVGFISLAHTPEHLHETLGRMETALKSMAF